MAIIDRLPEAVIVDGFRGTLDFYVVDGQVRVRSWPINKTAGSTPGARLHQPTFARANALKPFVSLAVKVATDRYRQGATSTWGDIHVKAFYGILRPNDVPLPTA